MVRRKPRMGHVARSMTASCVARFIVATKVDPVALKDGSGSFFWLWGSGILLRRSFSLERARSVRRRMVAHFGH